MSGKARPGSRMACSQKLFQKESTLWNECRKRKCNSVIEAGNNTWYSGLISVAWVPPASEIKHGENTRLDDGG